MIEEIDSLLAFARLNGIHLAESGGVLKVEAPRGALTEDFRARLAENKKALLERLAGSSVPPVHPHPEREHYPLSRSQLRMWTICQDESRSTAYNMSAVFEVSGPLDVDLLEKAVRYVIGRHDSLRTRFALVGGEPRQFVDTRCPFDFVRRDSLDRQNTLEAADEFVAHAFDLMSAPLCRALLVSLASERFVVAFAMHHILSDGWSVGVLLSDILASYQQLRGSGLPQLSELNIQYKDFCLWEQELLNNPWIDRAKLYWKNKLCGEVVRLNLPRDREYPAKRLPVGASKSLLLRCEISGKIRKLALDCNVTLFSLLTAAAKVLLHRYTGQEDIIVGTPVSCRFQASVADQIGLYVNTLPVRSKISDSSSLVELARAIQTNLIEDREWQLCPFDVIMDAIERSSAVGRNPLFDVMVVMDRDWALPALDGVVFMPIERRSISIKSDLLFYFRDSKEEIEIRCEYATDLFNADRIGRMLNHLEVLLDSAVAAPDSSLRELEILPAWEKQKLLVEFNPRIADYPRDTLAHELFEEVARECPERVALVFGDSQMSYGELDARSNSLARMLREQRGIGRDVLVAMLVERSFEMVVGILGILKAGGAYVPIDPAYPQDRIRVMLQDCLATLVLVNVDLGEGVIPEGCSILDLRRECFYSSATSNLARVNSPSDLVYCIYTSGSTGRPKGTLVEHRNFSNTLGWYLGAVGEKALSSVLVASSFSFDLTQKNYFAPLSCGGRVVLSAPGFPDSVALCGLAEREGVSLVNCAPSLFQAMAEAGASKLSSVKQVVLGGEPVMPSRLNKWLMTCSADAMLMNSYGPTECSDVVTSFNVGAREAVGYDSLPIGVPNSGVSASVLDHSGSLCPIGVTGELCISGRQVGRGYLNRPELTAEKFVTDPLRFGERMYRTGDLARWLPDGNLEFVGRMDDQVKIRGFRIELGEVETAMSSVVGIWQVAVVVREISGDRQLCGYYAGGADEATVKTKLKQKLPDYMVPSLITRLDELPLTSNGKVNRKALPPPKGQASRYVAPRNELEQRLATIWAEVLGVEQIGIEDNFFSLGGHSLKAVQLLVRIEDEIGVRIPLNNMFLAPTFSDLSASVDQALSEACSE